MHWLQSEIMNTEMAPVALTRVLEEDWMTCAWAAASSSAAAAVARSIVILLRSRPKSVVQSRSAHPL